MYKVNGFLALPVRRTLHELDFRAPEDRLGFDEADEREIRSPGIDRLIKGYYAADHAGDDSEKAEVLRDLIEQMTAVNKLRGVPIHAHPPLPPQFVASEIENARRTGGGVALAKLLHLIEPSDRPAVGLQIEQVLSAGEGARAGAFARESEPDSRWARITDVQAGHRPSVDDARRRDALRREAGGSLRRTRDERRRAGDDAATSRGTDAGSVAFAAQSPPPAGTYPRGREPDEVNSENPNYPWHPRWDRYNLHRDEDGNEWGEWHTNEGDYEWSTDGGKTWHKSGPAKPGGAWTGGPPNKSNNPKGTIYRKAKTDLIS